MVKRKVKKKVKKVSKDFWFKRCNSNLKSSWGFVPINWKGWVALVLLVGVNIFAADYFDVMNVSFEEISKFLVVFLLSIAVFVLIAKKRTG